MMTPQEAVGSPLAYSLDERIRRMYVAFDSAGDVNMDRLQASSETAKRFLLTQLVKIYGDEPSIVRVDRWLELSDSNNDVVVVDGLYETLLKKTDEDTVRLCYLHNRVV